MVERGARQQIFLFRSIVFRVELVERSPLFQAEEITNLKKQLNLIYVKHTGQELETIHNSLERDKFMNPQQALEFGLIDKVLEHPPKAGAEADKKEWIAWRRRIFPGDLFSTTIFGRMIKSSASEDRVWNLSLSFLVSRSRRMEEREFGSSAMSAGGTKTQFWNSQYSAFFCCSICNYSLARGQGGGLCRIKRRFEVTHLLINPEESHNHPNI